MKKKLTVVMENYFGNDIKRISHAKEVMKYAEMLLKLEGGDSEIVIPAAILHDVGIKIAEEKYNSSAGLYQEKEGPPIARKILEDMAVETSAIDEICEIIAHHHSPGKINTSNFKILYDADWLVNLKDEVNIEDKEKLEKTINKLFLTDSGKELAGQIYLRRGCL